MRAPSRFLILTLLASLMPAANALRAQVIYWDPEDTTIVSPDDELVIGFAGGDVYTGLEADSWDLGFTYGLGPGVLVFQPGSGIANHTLLGLPHALRLSAGALIDSTLTYAGIDYGGIEIVALNASSANDGEWAPDTHGYLAFFSGEHYGWVGLSYGSADGVETITLHDFALNSVAGQGLLAGTITAIPEPSTYAAALAALALAVTACRRRSRAPAVLRR